jgi:HAMP domain-containing protein
MSRDLSAYRDNLRQKLQILQAILTVSERQAQALAAQEEGLGELLKERQGYLEDLARARAAGRVQAGPDEAKDEETRQLETTFRRLLQATVELSQATLASAQQKKSCYAGQIRKLQLNRQAIREGYFKRAPQRYGYFIDKKIGDGS